MQHETTMAISGQQCRQMNPSLEPIIRSWLICTATEMERTNCFDGLGSPLVSSKDNILYGIVSMFRNPCGVAINDIYTNVYAQLPWIWFTIEGQ